MRRWSRTCCVVVGLLATTDGFAPSGIHNHAQLRTFGLSSRKSVPTAARFLLIDDDAAQELEGVQGKLQKKHSLIGRVWRRLDTLEAAGLKGNFPQLQRLRLMGGWKTYAWGLLFAFLYKWYRARYINKIPVWDRQPQWNTVVVNKEQEKELHAWTCKNCGATIFIARHRNWYFEGPAGFGGYGCYSCGAKGKDNFVMDRDRIVEEVGDDDDYFDYERPLDFVDAAERRALLKKVGGDEEKANLILSGDLKLVDIENVDATKEADGAPAPEASVTTIEEEQVVDAETITETEPSAEESPAEAEPVVAEDIPAAEAVEESLVVDAPVAKEPPTPEPIIVETQVDAPVAEEIPTPEPIIVESPVDAPGSDEAPTPEPIVAEETPVETPVVEENPTGEETTSTPVAVDTEPQASEPAVQPDLSSSSDDLDILGMDDF